MSDASFWPFSLALYSKTDIAEQCLRLQNQYHLDINLLLYCCWRAQLGQELSVKEIELAVKFSTLWRQQTVQPLRTIRKALKGLQMPPIPPQQIEALRHSVKEIELESEKLQQLALESLHSQQYKPKTNRQTAGTVNNKYSDALCNMQKYLAVENTDIGTELSLLQSLARASSQLVY